METQFILAVEFGRFELDDLFRQQLSVFRIDFQANFKPHSVLLFLQQFLHSQTRVDQHFNYQGHSILVYVHCSIVLLHLQDFNICRGVLFQLDQTPLYQHVSQLLLYQFYFNLFENLFLVGEASCYFQTYFGKDSFVLRSLFLEVEHQISINSQVNTWVNRVQFIAVKTSEELSRKASTCTQTCVYSYHKMYSSLYFFIV